MDQSSLDQKKQEIPIPKKPCCTKAWLFLLLFIFTFSLGGVGGYYLGTSKVNDIGLGFAPISSNNLDQVACTMEAKLCPDGSSVGRTGPNCEFAPCPNIDLIYPSASYKLLTNIDTTNWKTYTNANLGFEFKYPKTVKPTGNQELVVSNEDSNSVTISVPQTDMLFSIRLDKNESSIPLNDWWKSHFTGPMCKPAETINNFDSEAIVIDGKDAILIKEENDCKFYRNVFVSNNSYVYFISGTNDFSNGNLLVDQILSTFRFTE